jgi:hypothetical protein
MKNTNLLNPQVALTDKYGNDFAFSRAGRGEVTAKIRCEMREPTDNRAMMNEWWVFCEPLPWSLILIKQPEISVRPRFIHSVIFYRMQMRPSTAKRALANGHRRASAEAGFDMQMTRTQTDKQARSFINKSNFGLSALVTQDLGFSVMSLINQWLQGSIRNQFSVWRVTNKRSEAKWNLTRKVAACHH